ncbi:MAG: hypothetical protein ABH808_02575 [Candidatus Kuenenbacteria bacterium]
MQKHFSPGLLRGVYTERSESARNDEEDLYFVSLREIWQSETFCAFYPVK